MPPKTAPSMMFSHDEHHQNTFSHAVMMCLGGEGVSEEFFGFFTQWWLHSLIENQLSTSDFHSLTGCSESVQITHAFSTKSWLCQENVSQHPDKIICSKLLFMSSAQLGWGDFEHLSECSDSFSSPRVTGIWKIDVHLILKSMRIQLLHSSASEKGIWNL